MKTARNTSVIFMVIKLRQGKHWIMWIKKKKKDKIYMYNVGMLDLGITRLRDFDIHTHTYKHRTIYVPLTLLHTHTHNHICTFDTLTQKHTHATHIWTIYSSQMSPIRIFLADMSTSQIPSFLFFLGW